MNATNRQILISIAFIVMTYFVLTIIFPNYGYYWHNEVSDSLQGVAKEKYDNGITQLGSQYLKKEEFSFKFFVVSLAVGFIVYLLTIKPKLRNANP